MDRVQTYLDWKRKVEEQCLNNYLDPTTGKVDKLLEVNWAHRISIGGSSVSAIMGVNKWNSAEDVYDVMTGFLDNSTPNENKLFVVGHLAEPIIAQLFTMTTRIPTVDGKTIQDKNRPWSECQIDRLTLDGTPVELKTAYQNPMQPDGKRKFGRGCDFNAKGELLSVDDLIPTEYYIQCQKQLYLTNKPFMWLAVWLTNSPSVRVFKIKRDNDMITKIIKAEDDFMFEHVIPEIPLPKTEEEDEDKPEVKDDSVFADALMLDDLNQLNDIKANISSLTDKQKELTARIKKRMGDAQKLISINGDLLATKITKTVKKFDTKKFKDYDGELYNKFIIKNITETLNTISKED